MTLKQRMILNQRPSPKIKLQSTSYSFACHLQRTGEKIFSSFFNCAIALSTSFLSKPVSFANVDAFTGAFNSFILANTTSTVSIFKKLKVNKNCTCIFNSPECTCFYAHKSNNNFKDLTLIIQIFKKKSWIETNFNLRYFHKLQDY